MTRFALAIVLAALIGCGGEPENATTNDASDLTLDGLNATGIAGEADTVEIEEVGQAASLPIDDEGWTPMARRVAVLGILNKRNGNSRDITLRPGEARRVGDVVVRLQACERSAPWEPQDLTGAFVQLDVREINRETREPGWRRAFSGWLFKERPALNVIRHRLYDVWPKSCEMTHGASTAPRNAESGSDATPASPTRSAGEESDTAPETSAPPTSDPSPSPPADNAEPSIET